MVLVAPYERAQDDFVALAPTTPQIVATGSARYIQFSQPDLIVAAAEMVMDRVVAGQYSPT